MKSFIKEEEKKNFGQQNNHDLRLIFNFTSALQSSDEFRLRFN